MRAIALIESRGGAGGAGGGETGGGDGGGRDGEGGGVDGEAYVYTSTSARAKYLAGSPVCSTVTLNPAGSPLDAHGATIGSRNWLESYVDLKHT